MQVVSDKTINVKQILLITAANKFATGKFFPKISIISEIYFINFALLGKK